MGVDVSGRERVPSDDVVLPGVDARLETAPSQRIDVDRVRAPVENLLGDERARQRGRASARAR